jgi:ParB family chromosome partitioning protein
MMNYQSIDISKIKPSPYQARKVFDEAGIQSLAESLRQEGLMEPIVVRQVGQDFEVVSGERRLRAAKSIGWPTIEAKIIQTVSNAEAAAKGLIENLQREDLNPVEEAEGFKALLDLQDEHWTQQQIGAVVGKPQSRISESLRLLELPDTVLENIRQRIISREHGIELMRIDNANSKKGMANKIIKGGWSVKKTREAIDHKLGKGGSLRPPANKPQAQPVPEISRFISGMPTVPDPLSDLWAAAGVGKEEGPVTSYVQSLQPLSWTLAIHVQDLAAYREAAGGDMTKATRLCLADWFDHLAKACRTDQ